MEDLIVIDDIENAIISLKNKNILVIVDKNIKTYFLLKNNRIIVVSNNSKYSLSLDEFKTLFSSNTFVLYEKKEDNAFDFSRDDEYYSWKHK